MWLFVLAALGTAAAVSYGRVALERTRAKPAWNEARPADRVVTSAVDRRLQRNESNSAVGSSTHQTTEEINGEDLAPKELWVERDYYWVVVCRNDRFHQLQNMYYKHHIPLGETDTVLPPPPLVGPFPVTCDECGKEFLYRPSDVLKCEVERQPAFAPHALFQGRVIDGRGGHL